jgi:hypothetical protein
MTYAMSDAIWAMPPRLRTLRSWATVWSDRVDNTTDNSQEEIGYPFIVYYLLYMLIIQVYHDSGHVRDFGRMPDSGRMSNSGRISRLRSYVQLWSYIPTPVALPDSGRRHDSGRIY